MEEKVIMPTEDGYKAGVVTDKSKPQMTVEQLNEKVAEAGNMKKTKKQLEKEERDAKRYWNSMITRREAYEEIQQAIEPLSQQMQLLFVQNRTLIELIEKKGIATVDEINEFSKTVLESIFGTPPTDEKEKEEATQPEVEK